jgi:hypothetical protein
LFLQAVRQAIAARRRPHKLGHRPQQAAPTPWQAYSLGAGGGLLVLAFFLLPNEFAGGGYVKPRLAYLAGLMLLAALAALRLGPTKARICAALFVGALGALGLSYMHFQRHHSPALRAMAALGEQLPAHSAVLPVNYSEAPYTMHQLNYLVARQPLLLYENYEAYVGTFPLIWRPGSNAWGFMKGAGAQLGLEARPPWLPVGAFKRGGGAPAFVVTWQAPEQAPSSGRARRAYRWLQEHYRPVPSASELQGLRLYKRRPADQ